MAEAKANKSNKDENKIQDNYHLFRKSEQKQQDILNMMLVNQDQQILHQIWIKF